MDFNSPPRPTSVPPWRTRIGVWMMILSFRATSFLDLKILSSVPQIGMLLKAGQATGSWRMLSFQAMT